MSTGFHFDGGMERFTIDMGDAPVILFLMAAAIAAEVFLARKEDHWLGLTLPGALLGWTEVKFVVRAVRYHPRPENLFLALLVENLPTLILLAVYGLCRVRKRWRTARQLKKIRVEDL